MLHRDDLIFCKTESGVTSCGYNISNMLLKNTLNMSTPNRQYSSVGKTSSLGNTGKDDIRIAKLMEDLVVPSGLYYCHPMTKHKVFNYKPMQTHSPREKGEKDEIDITNGMLDESIYDKLLSLVSMDKKKLFDRKTRKNKNTFQKIKEGSTASDVGIDVDVDLELPKEEKGEKVEKGEKRDKSTKKKSIKLKINTQKLLENQQEKQKPNQRKTKKVRFADF
jgi:hypothetical protein